MPDPNSRSVPWKWLAVILTGVVFTLIAAWGNDITRRINLRESHDATQETRLVALENNFATILWRLERIDKKLDGYEERRR